MHQSFSSGLAEAQPVSDTLKKDNAALLVFSVISENNNLHVSMLYSSQPKWFGTKHEH